MKHPTDNVFQVKVGGPATNIHGAEAKARQDFYASLRPKPAERVFEQPTPILHNGPEPKQVQPYQERKQELRCYGPTRAPSCGGKWIVPGLMLGSLVLGYFTIGVIPAAIVLFIIVTLIS